MKKFKFTIHGNEYDVELTNIEGNIAEIEVNGTKYSVEIEKKMAQPITPKLMRTKRERSGDTHKSQSRTSRPGEKRGAGVINSPLPGTILSINSKVGDEVKQGDTLLILEAMKMENAVKATKAGKIESIKVNVGDSVLEGDTLVEIGD